MAKKIIEMDKLPKISSRTLESMRKETSRFILVNDKNGNAKCERCNSEFVLPKTKHMQENYKCPKCGKKMQIIHKWRRKNDDRVDWKIIASVVNDTKLVLRYILVDRFDYEVRQLEEVAREVIDFNAKQKYFFERNIVNGNVVWKRGTWNFFRETGMGYYYRRYCCLQGDVHNLKVFLNELKKMTIFKYFDFTDILPLLQKWYVESLVSKIGNKSLAYEQLQKAGYQQLVIDDIDNASYYSKPFQYDPTQKSLSKKLGLTEDNFRRLKDNQTLSFYKVLLENPNITDEDLSLVSEFGYDNFFDINKACKIFQLKRGKTIQYIRKQVISDDLRVTDYVDYLRLIDKLNYPIDNRYAYPKDFRAFKQVIVKRYNEYMERIRNMTPKELAIEEAKKDKKMYLISKALRENKELRSWFEGADGLKVFVPESVGELVDSGVNLHNCLGNYADKIVSNVSILFFIRRIDEPDKDYIAMEYRYGKVNQLRLDDNVEVKDTKIINFAEALARKLNEINANEKIIATAIREVA